MSSEWTDNGSIGISQSFGINCGQFYKLDRKKKASDDDVESTSQMEIGWEGWHGDWNQETVS